MEDILNRQFSVVEGGRAMSDSILRIAFAEVGCGPEKHR